MISASSLHKNYGTVKALRGISFNVSKGEIFGIVGPDGAGKSTMMKICATTMQPDSGTLIIDGKDVSQNLYSVREKIAYMPQKFGLYEDLTVEENAYFFAKLYGVSKSIVSSRLKRLYDFSNLGQFKERKAGALSGGMKQKLGLICCLVHTPELLVLDEPTNGVDPVSRREFWAILYDLLVEGVAIIVSTAYLDEAERCSRLALLHNGSFMAVDTVQNVKRSAGKDCISIEAKHPAQIESVLTKKGKLTGISRTGNTLRLFADDAGGIRGIERLLKANKMQSYRIQKINARLEDCFLKLTAKRTVLQP
jgi:ABC-2 type transport system ATP-binding protein